MSALLRRFYYDSSSQQYVWINDEGNMVYLSGLVLETAHLWKSRPTKRARLKAYADIANYVDKEHNIRIGPWCPMNAHFWVFPGDGNPAYCHRDANFKHLL